MKSTKKGKYDQSRKAMQLVKKGQCKYLIKVRQSVKKGQYDHPSRSMTSARKAKCYNQTKAR